MGELGLKFSLYHRIVIVWGGGRWAKVGKHEHLTVCVFGMGWIGSGLGECTIRFRVKTVLCDFLFFPCLVCRKYQRGRFQMTVTGHYLLAKYLVSSG